MLTGFSIVRELPLLWYVICGTKGCLETKGCGWDSHRAYFKPLSKGREMTRVSDEDVNDVAREVYNKLLPQGVPTSPEHVLANEFVKSIIEDVEPPIDVYKALDYTLPGMCAHMSAEKGGKIVDVPNPRTF